MPSIDDVLAAAGLRKESVSICVAGDLNAQWEVLGRELADLTAMTAGEPEPTAKLSDASPLSRRSAIRDQMEELRQRMQAASFTFQFQALPRRQYRDLRDAHPDPRGQRLFDGAAFPPVLIRKCLIDPVITSDDQFDQLMDKLTEGQVTELFNGAWLCNEGGSEVPKFVPGFAQNRSTGPS